MLIGPGGCYIGSSKNIKKRVQTHRYKLKYGMHQNGLLQNAYAKHGPFEGRVLLVCRESDLVMYEQLCMDAYEPRYNIARIVDGRPVYSLESRARMSATRKGRKQTEETKERRAAALRGRKRPMTPEQRAAHKIAMNRPEVKKKIGDARRGKTLSAEHCKKLSEAHKGQKPTNIEQLRAIATGRKLSDETKQKISEARRRRALNDQASNLSDHGGRD